MPMFRKKPIVIEAMRIDTRSDGLGALFRFSGESITDWDAECITVRTLEGDMRGNNGDYLIKGINGEFYPCKPDIFEKTYESCEGDADND